jgi:hypothetical protein
MDKIAFPLLSRLNLGRLFIAVVVSFNLQCAVLFLVSPASYAPAFELSGFKGEIVISSLGILFIMWNIPYLFALYHPARFRVSLIQAVLMQAVGFVGESILWLNAPIGHELMRASILRFMLFDGAGLLLLAAAFLLVNFIPND